MVLSTVTETKQNPPSHPCNLGYTRGKTKHSRGVFGVKNLTKSLNADWCSGPERGTWPWPLQRPHLPAGQVTQDRDSRGARCKIFQNKVISLLQSTNAENSKQILLEKELRAATIPISTFLCLWAIYMFPWWSCRFCWRNMWTDPGNI